MPSDPRRFRNLFLYAAGAVVFVVLIAYGYKRLTFHPIAPAGPAQLTGPVERNTQGFSLSKSEGGRTLFTIHAAQAVEYKEGQRAHLRDVSIIVYGKTGDRFDQISGPDFEYDPNSGDVQAHGPVQIDLEPNPEGMAHPDQAPPREQKNIIHIKTSELQFNQKTGLADTKERVQFTFPSASGTAVGAHMDSRQGIVVLQHQVDITTTGDHPAHIVGARGTLTRDPRRAIIETAHITQPDRDFTTDLLTAFLNQQNEVGRMLAEGHVVSAETAPSGDRYNLQSPQAEFFYTGHNRLHNVALHGGVTLDAQGTHLAHGTSQDALIDFDAQQHLSKIHAQGNVHLAQLPQKTVTTNGKNSGGQGYDLFADAVDLFSSAGHLDRGETFGAARIEIQPQPTPADPSPEKTTVTAAKFTAHFDNAGRLHQLHGEPDAKIASPNPEYGEPDRVSTSVSVDSSFDPKGQIVAMLQKGNVHYQDGEHEAFAAQARYTPPDQILVLTGSPRVLDNQSGNTTADVIRFNRATNIAYADGNVKSTYVNQKANPNGAMLGSSSPVHVTSDKMETSKSAGASTYTGHARLWQDANIIQAPEIQFFRDQHSMKADASKDQPVESVLVQTSADGKKQTPANITAQHFLYLDGERKAHYEGNVVMKSEDGTVTARQLDAYLKPRSETSPPKPSASKPGSPQPSQLDHAIAQGDVVLRQPGRTGIGDKLVYTDSDQKFVLTGAPGTLPEVTDVQHGVTRGDRLIFFRGSDNRVLVESAGADRAYTQTHVK